MKPLHILEHPRADPRDEIRAVLACIASHWSGEMLTLRAEIPRNARQR